MLKRRINHQYKCLCRQFILERLSNLSQTPPRMFEKSQICSFLSVTVPPCLEEFRAEIDKTFLCLFGRQTGEEDAVIPLMGFEV